MKLKESINKLNEDVLYTYSEIDLINFMNNTLEDGRILYDAREGLYLFGKAYDIIHGDLFEAAYENGLYDDQLDFIKSLGTIENYFDDGQDGYFENENDENERGVDSGLYRIIFVPIEENIYNYVYDGYNQCGKALNDNVYYLSDYDDFRETPLYKKLGKVKWEELQ